MQCVPKNVDYSFSCFENLLQYAISWKANINLVISVQSRYKRERMRSAWNCIFHSWDAVKISMPGHFHHTVKKRQPWVTWERSMASNCVGRNLSGRMQLGRMQPVCMHLKLALNHYGDSTPDGELHTSRKQVLFKKNGLWLYDSH